MRATVREGPKFDEALRLKSSTAIYLTKKLDFEKIMNAHLDEQSHGLLTVVGV